MYQVLALKYRPRSLEDLVGQDNIANMLSRSLDKDMIANSYLFSGIRGSGKTSTARIFAKCLLCENAPTSTPCEVCDSCKMCNENRHIDLIELDAASNRGIDDIKSIIEQSLYKPNISKYKVFIIDEVHMVTTQGFNAFLKTLEEPNITSKFILATTDPLKVPVTILSRTQHYRFKKISNKDIENRLKYVLLQEKVDFDEKALEVLSRSGKGSMRDTLTLLDQLIVFSNGNIDISSVSDMLNIVDPQFLENFFDNIYKQDIEKVKVNIETLKEYDVDILIDEMSMFLQEKLFSRDVKFSPIIIDRFYRVLSDSKHLLSINTNSYFVLTLMSFKLIECLKIKDIDFMIADLEKEVFNDRVVIESTLTKKEEPKIVDDFDKILQKIYHRNPKVGDCFKNGISFISFEENELKLENNIIDENCKKLLRYYSADIRNILKDIFGLKTKIEFISSPSKTKKPTQEITEEVQEEVKEEVKEDQNEIIRTKSENKQDSYQVEDMQNIQEETIVDIPEQQQTKDIKSIPIIKRAINMLDIDNISVR